MLIAIGFSFIGLNKLTPGAADIPSEAFRAGLVGRSALLGDPTDPANEGYPSNWIVGATGKELDAIIVTAGTERAKVTARATDLQKKLKAAGVTVELEHGDVRKDLPGHEHFGFDDGISQPGIRGLASDDANDFITERHVTSTPEGWLYGYPGQDLIWPGEFVIGYPASSPDPLIPGPVASALPAWTKNGSFLVYRRLRQNVGLFWRTMKSEADRLDGVPGFSGMKDTRLASLLVGRWPSGAPISRVPNGDDPKLGADQLANNSFFFDSNSPELKVKGKVHSYPTAEADPVGTTCPLAAHIRKVNTRDSSSDMGARSSTYERRILRVGVPFGKPRTNSYAKDTDDPVRGNRGLLFLSIQSSIEEQFEFLQARWINDDSRPKMPGGNDMIVGQNAPVLDGVRRCTIFGAGLAQGQVQAAGQWVVPTGGGYFFVPSLRALREVIAGEEPR